MKKPLLRVLNLSVCVKDKKNNDHKIVDNITFDINPGQVIALIGESGSGKTTISLSCMGYARPGCFITDGLVELGDENVLNKSLKELQTLRGKEITYVAQSAAASFNGAMTINSQVAEIPIITKSMSRDEALKKAEKLYKALELPNPSSIGSRYPHQVSGGQLQRLMAAMAMISDPKLLILDEPTTALDVTTQIEVLHSFKKLIKENNTAAIYVTHDLSLVAQIADHILVLKDGKQIEYGTTDQIINNPKEDYTKALIDAAHVMPDEINSPLLNVLKAPPLLEVKDVTAGYGKNQEIIAVEDINLVIEPGETVGVIGESGSGKTTLGRLISGLMAPTTGEIFLSKCHFTKVIKLNINDLNFIKEIRKIKLDEEKSVLKGSRYGINKILEHEYFKTTSLDNIKNNNNKYKKKYIDNKDMNDKIKYKYFKYKFLTNK